MGKDKSAETLRFGGFFYFFMVDSVKKKQDRQAIVDGVKCLTEPVQTASAISVKTIRRKRAEAK